MSQAGLNATFDDRLMPNGVQFDYPVTSRNTFCSWHPGAESENKTTNVSHMAVSIS